jgi:hypothetical protein
MKNAFIAALLAVQLCAAAAPTPDPAPEPAPSPRPSDEAIHQAIREVLEANPADPHHPGPTMRANKYEVFGQQFDEARVPDCLHPDALKRQPPTIGPIAFVGLYAVPFVVVAKIRGKCQ